MPIFSRLREDFSIPRQMAVVVKHITCTILIKYEADADERVESNKNCKNLAKNDILWCQGGRVPKLDKKSY